MGEGAVAYLRDTDPRNNSSVNRLGFWTVSGLTYQSAAVITFKLWDMYHMTYCMATNFVQPHKFSPNCLFSPYMLISQEKPKDVEHKCKMQSTVWKQAAPKGSNLPSYPPTVSNLLHQQGLSALQIEAQKITSVGADFSLNCCTSSILTQDFIAVSRKGITPDSPLTGMGECVCLRSSQSKMMLSMHGAQNVHL